MKLTKTQQEIVDFLKEHYTGNLKKDLNYYRKHCYKMLNALCVTRKSSLSGQMRTFYRHDIKQIDKIIEIIKGQS